MRSKFALSLLVLLSPLAALAEPGVVVDVTLNPAGDFKMKTNEVKGFAVVNGDKVTAENIVVDLRNVKTGMALRDKHARDKYLDVKKYPEAVLIKGEGQGGKGKGTLKIRGVEKEVAGTYKVDGNELTATFKIKVSDFGIKGVKYMGVGVEDEAQIEVKVPVKKGAATAGL